MHKDGTLVTEEEALLPVGPGQWAHVALLGHMNTHPSIYFIHKKNHREGAGRSIDEKGMMYLHIISLYRIWRTE